MHNGLRILTDSYYGSGIRDLLIANKGCHEPQEEVVFRDIIGSLPDESTIIELGAYWSFYSMWFLQIVKKGKAFMVEPIAEHIRCGRRNFEINQFQGEFVQSYVGSEDDVHQDGTPIVTVCALLKRFNLDKITLLHADIQEFELEMLKGATPLLEQHLVDYLFISTHTSELHDKCADFLRKHNYTILVSISIKESYSYDGILVAHSNRIDPPVITMPSKRQNS